MCRLCCVFIVSLLGGCSLAPKYNKPSLDIPEISSPDFVALAADRQWWRTFEDDVLNELENAAIKNNHDMIIAVKNVEEAAAALNIAYASLFPSVSTKSSGNKYYLSTDGVNGTRGVGKRGVVDYAFNLNMAYELDIFGKNRNNSDVKYNQMLATRAAQESVFLSLTSSVAKAYFSLLSIAEQVRIAEKTLASRQKTYDMFLHRFKNGVCKELDLRRVEAEKLGILAKLHSLNSAMHVAQTALSLLTGASPKDIIEKYVKCRSIFKVKLLQHSFNTIDSNILLMRPDISAAEYELKAANANIGLARAAFFPSILLTGSAGNESSSLASLFSGATDVFNFGGSVSLPLFSGGKLIADEKIAKIRYEKAVENYKKTVKSAFKDAWDAINVYNNSKVALAAVCDEEKAIKRGYDLAQNQEKEGLIGLVDLLDVERLLLSVQMDHVCAVENALTSAVNLFKAIGCGTERQ